MKRYLIFALMIAMLLPSLLIAPASAAQPGEPIGNVLYSDVVAYIDGYPIRSYNIAGNTYIVVEDLMDYGFSVQWLPAELKLVIGAARTAQPSAYQANYTPEKNTHAAGTVAMPYLYTEITTWIGSNKVTSYNIGGFTCICMDDLAKYFSAEYTWNPSDGTLRLVTSSDIRDPAKENQTAIDMALAKLRVSSDKIRGLTWYHGSSSPSYVDIRSYFLPYIAVKSGETNLLLRGHYYGKDWVFMKKITVYIDGVNYYFSFNYSDVNRDNSGGSVWETVHIPSAGDYVDMLWAIANSTETIIRFEGDNKYRDMTVSATDKQSIKDVLTAYVLLTQG